jgi:hypothetical protein
MDRPLLRRDRLPCDGQLFAYQDDEQREDALDYRVIEQSQNAFEFDVTGCRYAQFYQELGEPELGFLLVCSADFPMAEGFGPDKKFMRTQTVMQGASHCDFRYRRSGETDSP